MKVVILAGGTGQEFLNIQGNPKPMVTMRQTNLWVLRKVCRFWIY